MLQTTLHLDALDIRHEGLTKAVAASFREAAEVCFDRHHSPPTTVTIDRGRLINAVVHWNTPDDRTRRAWANQIDTTEAGAYCVALAAVELTDGLVAFQRAEILTGADYYVIQHGTTPPVDLESATRLEVSGIDEGGVSSVRIRLRQKLDQTGRGRSNLPAIAAVVAFSSAHVSIADAPK